MNDNSLYKGQGFNCDVMQQSRSLLLTIYNITLIYFFFNQNILSRLNIKGLSNNGSLTRDMLLPEEYAVIIETGQDDVYSLLSDAHFRAKATRL